MERGEVDRMEVEKDGRARQVVGRWERDGVERDGVEIAVHGTNAHAARSCFAMGGKGVRQGRRGGMAMVQNTQGKRWKRPRSQNPLPPRVCYGRGELSSPTCG